MSSRKARWRLSAILPKIAKMPDNPRVSVMTVLQNRIGINQRGFADSRYYLLKQRVRTLPSSQHNSHEFYLLLQIMAPARTIEYGIHDALVSRAAADVAGKHIL